MSWVAVAVGGGALIGAGASIYGANKNADAIGDGADQAAAFQNRALDASIALSRPQLEVGNSALGVLASLYGLAAPSQIDFDNLGGKVGLYKPGSGLSQQQQGVINSFVDSFGFNPLNSPEQAANVSTDDFASNRHFSDYAAFQAAFGYDPLSRDGNPYLDQTLQTPTEAAQQTDSVDLQSLINDNPIIQFQRQQGEQTLDRAAAARGLSQSGGALKDLLQFNNDVTAQGAQQFVLNPLFELAGFGQRATAGASSAFQNTGNNLSNLAFQSADARGSAYQNAGNSIANLGNTALQLGLMKHFGVF